VFTRKSISLIAVLAALAMLAVSATSAWATEVTPAEEKVELNLAAGSSADFIPNNAFNPAYVRCTTSHAATEIGGGALETNKNQSGVGAFSSGSGSVLLTAEAPPTFENCGVFVREKPGEVGKEEISGVTSVANNTNGEWTIAHLGQSSTGGIGAIGVPSNGVTVTIPLGGGNNCILTISPGEASSVTGVFTNNTPSRLAVDGQVNFAQSALCAALGVETPAQFEGTYDVTTANPAEEPVEVKE
jgi:hypothetical protein